MTARDGYIAGLRGLAVALERHPEIPLPILRDYSAIFYTSDANVAATLGDALTVQEVSYEPQQVYPHTQRGMIHGLPVTVYGPAMTAEEAAS